MAQKMNPSCHLRKDRRAPEAAAQLRQSQQPPARHAHENETLRTVNARTVQTPSFADVLSHGVDAIAIQLQLERAPRDRHAQRSQ
eukprot:5484451-Pyramimonas_sp.AAC.1